MATLLKESFIHKILTSGLTSTQLNHLNDLLNGYQATPTSVSLLPDKSNSIGNGNKGTSYVAMEIEPGKVVNGFLCYKDNDNCGLFTFSGTQEEMNSIELHPYDSTYVYHYEGLDIEELRRELNDLILAGSPQEIDAESLYGLIQAGDGFIADLSEDETKVEMHLDQDVLDAISLKKIDTEDLSITTSDGNTIITIASGVISSSNHIHLMFEIEGTGIHFGSDCILHPYSTGGDVCFVSGIIDVNGSLKDYTAVLDSDGTVNINILDAEITDVTASNIKVHYTTFIEE